jgi:anthranilate synthase component 1
MLTPTRDEFLKLTRAANEGAPLAVPVALRLLSDQLTPVLAYRRLVAPDQRTAPSFLLESVENGLHQGRHSILGARPAIEVVAKEQRVTIENHRTGERSTSETSDPLATLRDLASRHRFIRPPGRWPEAPLGGWFGYAGYDAVRYAEPDKLPFAGAPLDDRALPDLHFAFYDQLAIFDHAEKTVTAVALALLEPGDDPGAAYDAAARRAESLARELETPGDPLATARLAETAAAPQALESNLTRDRHAAMVDRAKEYIAAGDIFQVVLGQRFETRAAVDPFEVYRALRAVNPSPYMVYLQARGCILVASSPEILCRVRRDETTGRSIITNRPLAGTRRRGASPDEDAALEAELLADPKECAEHAMLVDLGRNDVGKVAEPGSVQTPRLMEIERYSHVMHISSTVTGALREELDAWDALRAALPVGTISGAPKIRAMQIIDELEPLRRGPYGGGMGYVSLAGDMDIALTLRTIVVPTERRDAGKWNYHIQAAGGIVADSEPAAEYDETVNKAAALARAVELARQSFQPRDEAPETSLKIQ